MKVHKGFFVVLAFLFLMFLSAVKGYSQAPCPDPVMIVEDGFVFNTIQGAYDDASLRWTDFTLLLVAETFNEDLFIDSGSVLLDGGYDCTFSTKTLPTGILGSITISAGAVTFNNIGVLSPPACAFDSDGDGFTSIGSCTGSANDCDDSNPNTFPGAPEICDGADNNCDGGSIDENLTQATSCGEGACAGNTGEETCTAGVWGGDTCDPLAGATAEILGDGIDQDCDGQDLLFFYENDCFASSCHGGPDPIDTINNQLHQSVGAPDDTCAACHAAKVNAVLPGHYGETVRTTDNNMAAGAIISCTSCHDYHDPIEYDIGGANIVWPKVSATWNGSTYVNLTCDTCHEDRAARHGAAHTVEVGPNDLSYDPPGQLCSVCHDVANWTDIEGTEHNVDTNGDGSCATCHDSPRAEVQITLDAGTPPIHCLDCHSDKDLTVHGAADHSSLVRVGMTDCGNCHTDPPPLVDPADPKVHNACTSCHEADFSLRSLAIGKSFAVGGDCTTCHGDHFPSHSHHNGANNDVSYNETVDTSQTSQQGCAVCHHDYDTVNSTSLGLSTWETILVEHDLDGTKDGSANTCDNCHAYNGNGSAPLAAVQSAIASSNPATCATCHTDKVPDVNHGVPTSGKHPGHLALTGVSCGTCHDTDNYPYFKSGTQSNGDGLFDLNETDVCEACHQDAAGNPSAGFKNGWSDPGFVLDCSGCHAGTPATGSHTSHLSLAGCGSCHDGTVAATTAPVQHLDENIDVYDITPADLGYPADKAIGSVYGSCSASYCHSSAQGTVDPTDPPIYATSPSWGTPYADTITKCNSCHDAGAHSDVGTPISTGGHGTHLPYKFDQGGVCQACHFDWNYTACTNCHSRRFNHVDNSIDVVFNPTFPLGVASSSGSYSGDPAPQTDYGNCNNLYCHSAGTRASAPYDAPNVTVLAWGATGLPTDCTGCHGGDSATASMMDTGSHLKHIESYDCSKCHSYTVADSRTLRPDRIIPTESRSYGHYYHVDGKISIAFAPDIATNGTYAGELSPLFYRQAGSPYGACGNLYCHSDGTSVATGSIQPYTSATWGSGPLSCDSCHGFAPDYPNGSPKANSHQVHGTNNCHFCHAATTTTGTSITNPANHVNGIYDIEAGDGVSFSYSAGTCSNISCHQGGSADWGSTTLSFNCDSCHGYPPVQGDGLNVNELYDGGKGVHVTGWQQYDSFGIGGHILNSDLLQPATDRYGDISTGYNECVKCHMNGLHGNGKIDVEILDSQWSTITNKGPYERPDGFGMGPPIYNGVPGEIVSPKSCSNIICHQGDTPRWSCPGGE